MEDWRVIEGFDRYEVSDQGRVRNRVTGLFLKPFALGSRGYPGVTLRAHGKSYTRFVHVLVASGFLGPPPSPDHEVAHADGTRSNNRAGNLRWATVSENQADRIGHGTNGRKLVNDEVLEIRSLRQRGFTLARIAERFGVSEVTVHQIVRRSRWKHLPA